MTYESTGASVANIRALIRDAGVMRALRKAMGLGDTLGAVPLESLGITLTDDPDADADRGAEDGYAVTPKGLERYMERKKGATAMLSSSVKCLSSKTSESVTISFANAKADGGAVSRSGSTLVVNEGGVYDVALKGTVSLYAARGESTAPRFSTTLVLSVSGLGTLKIGEGSFTLGAGTDGKGASATVPLCEDYRTRMYLSAGTSVSLVANASKSNDGSGDSTSIITGSAALSVIRA